jgi:hypothetical protein
VHALRAAEEETDYLERRRERGEKDERGKNERKQNRKRVVPREITSNPSARVSLCAYVGVYAYECMCVRCVWTCACDLRQPATRFRRATRA